MSKKSSNTGSFSYDLNVSLIFGNAKSDNRDVAYFLNEFPIPYDLTKSQIGEDKESFSKLKCSDIRNIYKNSLIQSFSLDPALSELIKTVKRINDNNKYSSEYKRFLTLKELSKRTKEMHWLTYIFPKLVVCVFILKEISFHHPLKNMQMTQPMTIMFYLMFNIDPKVAESFSRIKNKLGLNIEEEVYKAVQNDIEIVKRSFPEKDYPELGDASKIEIDTFYDEEIVKIYDKEFAGSSIQEIVDNMWESNEGIDYLLNRVRKTTIKKLTKRDNLRRQMDNMRKQGTDEIELDAWRKLRVSEIFNLHDPISITNCKEGDDKNVRPEESIELDYKYLDEQEEKVSYVETKKEIKKILVDCKRSLFKNSPAGKATMDYFINNLGNDSAKFTNREIANSTNYHEDTIGRLCKKLYKNSPLSRELFT